MYTHKNYKTKKALKDDLNAGAKISVYQPGGIFPGETDGWISLEGPHYPAPHSWYASALIKDSVIQKLKNPHRTVKAGEPLTKGQMITEIMNAYKAGCLSNKKIKYREQMKLDETWLALAFRTDQELRNICHELGIKTKNPRGSYQGVIPIPGEEMHSSTVPAFQMSQSVGQREMKSVWHKGEYWIGGYSRWGLMKFAVLGRFGVEASHGDVYFFFRVRNLKGVERHIAGFFTSPTILFVDAVSARMHRRYFPNHRWINVNNTKTGGKW